MECRICNNSSENTAYDVPEMMFGLGDRFAYFQCSRCKCLQIVEIPSNMSRYYPGDYYSLSSKSLKRYRNPIRKWWRRTKDHFSALPNSMLGKIFDHLYPQSRFKMLGKIPLSRESRILDVGCGSGWSLYALREAGFRNLLGIDPYLEQDVRYDNGLEIKKLTIGDLSGAWDVIMYNHSFEHVPDPHNQLLAVSRLLVNSGVCLIRIPIVSSYAWEHYREHWVQLDAPRHYYLFSVESMEILAARSGFSIQAVEYDSTAFQFTGSELYRRGIPLVSDKANSVFPKALQREWRRKANILNAQRQGDQAAFYLAKSN